MQISDFLSPSDALVDMHAADKAQVLEALARRAASSLNLDPGLVAAEILKREGLGSTGVGDGVAIPHARIQRIRKPAGIFARLAKAIDFDAIDGKPVDLVFLLLLPATPQGEQLNALALVARRLRDRDVREHLRHASGGSALHRGICHGPEKPAKA